MTRALICGVSGQDGAYLARLLLGKGYEVWGTSRDAQVSSFVNLERLGIRHRVHLLSMAQTDFRSVLNALVLSEPDEAYFLSGQSSVGLSFDQPAESMESLGMGVLNLLEAIRFLRRPVRVYHASSSDCFGEVPEGEWADERSPFRPRSPYGVAKASAHWLVANYRDAYGLFCCNGILFNHESPLRPERFVTRKVVSTALRIAEGRAERLTLGCTDIARDWGWAPDYVEAMWRMLQQPAPDDYVIATGETRTLAVLVAQVFDAVGLDWHDHVVSDPQLFRPSDILRSAGNPARAAARLGWRPTLDFSGMIDALIAAERERR